MALAKDIDIKNRGTCDRLDGKMIASDIIYKGSLVKVNAAGNIAPCAAEAGARFAGVAVSQVDNSSGAADVKDVEFFATGMHLLTCSDTLTKANIGDLVYAEDDETVSVSQASNEQWCGVIVMPFVSASKCWVNINAATAGAASVN